MKPSIWHWKVDQSLLLFLPLDHNAKPMVPSANPATDAPYEKKFKKKVDSSTSMTIKRGRTIPRNIRAMPSPRRKPGDLIIYLLLTSGYGSEGVFW
jgi:hypothetical protein